MKKPEAMICKCGNTLKIKSIYSESDDDSEYYGELCIDLFCDNKKCILRKKYIEQSLLDRDPLVYLIEIDDTNKIDQVLNYIITLANK